MATMEFCMEASSLREVLAAHKHEPRQPFYTGFRAVPYPLHAPTYEGPTLECPIGLLAGHWPAEEIRLALRAWSARVGIPHAPALSSALSTPATAAAVTATKPAAPLSPSPSCDCIPSLEYCAVCACACPLHNATAPDDKRIACIQCVPAWPIGSKPPTPLPVVNHLVTVHTPVAPADGPVSEVLCARLLRTSLQQALQGYMAACLPTGSFTTRLLRQWTKRYRTELAQSVADSLPLYWRKTLGLPCSCLAEAGTGLSYMPRCIVRCEAMLRGCGRPKEAPPAGPLLALPPVDHNNHFFSVSLACHHGGDAEEMVRCPLWRIAPPRTCCGLGNDRCDAPLCPDEECEEQDAPYAYDCGVCAPYHCEELRPHMRWRRVERTAAAHARQPCCRRGPRTTRQQTLLTCPGSGFGRTCALCGATGLPLTPPPFQGCRRCARTLELQTQRLEEDAARQRWTRVTGQPGPQLPSNWEYQLWSGCGVDTPPTLQSTQGYSHLPRRRAPKRPAPTPSESPFSSARRRPRIVSATSSLSQ